MDGEKTSKQSPNGKEQLLEAVVLRLNAVFQKLWLPSSSEPENVPSPNVTSQKDSQRGLN